MKNFKTYFWFILSGILGVATVLTSIEASSSGFEVAKLEKEGKYLTSENRELSGSLIQGASLNSIGLKSEGLGFAKPEKILYINGEQNVALKI